MISRGSSRSAGSLTTHSSSFSSKSFSCVTFVSETLTGHLGVIFHMGIRFSLPLSCSRFPDSGVCTIENVSPPLLKWKVQHSESSWLQVALPGG
jgi:hypothetical protein